MGPLFSRLCVARRKARVNKTSSPGPKVVVRVCRGNKIHQNFTGQHNWGTTSRRCICVWGQVEVGSTGLGRPLISGSAAGEIWGIFVAMATGAVNDPDPKPQLSQRESSYSNPEARKMLNWSKKKTRCG